MLEKFSIRTQILITFAVMATISLLVVSAISIANVNRVGEITEEQASDALNDQVERNILLSSSENADIIEKKFRTAESDVRKIGDATSAIFSGNVEFEPVQSYDQSELSSIPDVREDPTYGEQISPTTSTYYSPNAALDNGQLTEAANETIELSAHVDSTFASIFERTSEYVWMYIAFSPSQGEISRNFPGAAVDDTGAYRPSTQEDYYIDAVDAQGDIVYTAPYFDLTQGLVITISQAIYDDQGNILGVVGIDFKTTVIQDKVLNVNFLESGYASLIEADDETVIAHPNWDSENHDENDPIPTLSQVEPGIDTSTRARLSAGSQDVVTYADSGKTYYLAYAPILADGGNPEYIFLIHVLASEVLEPVDDISSRIQSSVSSIRGSVIGLSLATLIGTLAVGLWIAGSITKPVARLTRIARQITRNATKEDIFEGVDFGDSLESDDEIGDLSRSFQSMVGQLREEQRQKSQKK